MTPLEKVGHHCMPSWDIGFDDVEVGEDALMGEAGRGFRHVMSTLHYSRAGQAANSVGQAQKAVDLAVAHAKERRQFGRPIGSFEIIQRKIATLAAECYALDSAVMVTGGMVDRGGIDFSLETAA